MTTTESAGGPASAPLAPFVGRWRTGGEILAGPSTPAVPVAGEDTYAWLPGGFALLHLVEVRMGAEAVRLVEVIGYDASDGTYAMHSFDGRGNAGSMRAAVRDGVWTFTGGTERFTGGFSEDGNTLSGRWERKDGSAWLPWMEIRLTREG